MSKEIHALSAAAKPVATWMGIEALGEARRACGGHGSVVFSINFNRTSTASLYKTDTILRYRAVKLLLLKISSRT